MAAAVPGLTPEQISAIDAAHLWRPYSTIGAEAVPPVVAVGARGARLTVIRDGEPVEVLGAMSSWWTAIHRARPSGPGRGAGRPAGDDDSRHVRRADP
jgi:adenosylmethionine---8-amino-7-oxononanoate aminotransferase